MLLWISRIIPPSHSNLEVRVSTGDGSNLSSLVILVQESLKLLSALFAILERVRSLEEKQLLSQDLLEECNRLAERIGQLHGALSRLTTADWSLLTSSADFIPRRSLRCPTCGHLEW